MQSVCLMLIQTPFYKTCTFVYSAVSVLWKTTYLLNWTENGCEKSTVDYKHGWNVLFLTAFVCPNISTKGFFLSCCYRDHLFKCHKMRWLLWKAGEKTGDWVDLKPCAKKHGQIILGMKKSSDLINRNFFTVWIVRNQNRFAQTSWLVYLLGGFEHPTSSSLERCGLIPLLILLWAGDFWRSLGARVVRGT